MSRPIPKDPGKTAALWASEPALRSLIIERLVEQCRFDALRLLGTPAWPVDLPVSLFATLSRRPGYKPASFWASATAKDDPSLLEHIRMLDPAAFGAALRADKQHNSALIEAIISKQAMGVLRHAIANDWLTHVEAGYTPGHILCRASAAGWEAGVDWLLSSGSAHPDARSHKTYFSRTPLMLAARLGHVGVVNRLLAAGADPHLRDDRQKQALFILMEDVKNGGELRPTAHALVQGGASVDEPTSGPRSLTIRQYVTRHLKLDWFLAMSAKEELEACLDTAASSPSRPRM